MLLHSTRYRQRGLTMLEALITMLLVSLIGMGIAFVAGRTLVAQRQGNVQHLAVNQLRLALQNGNCTSSAVSTIPVRIASQTIAASCRSESVTLTVVPASGSQQNVVVPMPSITVEHPMLGGKVIVDPVQ